MALELDTIPFVPICFCFYRSVGQHLIAACKSFFLLYFEPTFISTQTYLLHIQSQLELIQIFSISVRCILEIKKWKWQSLACSGVKKR